MSRRGSAVAALVALAAGLLVAQAAPAKADVVWRYGQFNLAGDTIHDGGLGSADVVVYYTAYKYQVWEHPAAWSLQEICWDPAGPNQYTHIASALGTLSYYGAMKALDFNGATNVCPYSGIAAFAIASAPPNPYYYGETFFPTQYPGDDLRGMLCISVPAGTQAHNACTTHFTNDDDDYAAEQLGEADGFDVAYAVSKPGPAHYFGGDFNLCYLQTRTWPDVDPYLGRIEADAAPLPPPPSYCYIEPPQRTHNLEKLDYSFVRQADFDDGDVVLHDYVPEYSDHMLVEGIFTQ